MAHCVRGCEEGDRKSNVFYCMMSCVCSHILHAFTHPAWRAVRAGMRRVSESLIYSTAWCRVYILTPVTPCECRNFCGARRGTSQPTLCRRMIIVCNSTCRQVNLSSLFRMHRPLLWNHMADMALYTYTWFIMQGLPVDKLSCRRWSYACTKLADWFHGVRHKSSCTHRGCRV